MPGTTRSRIESKAHLSTLQVQRLRFLMEEAPWTHEEVRNPPGRHLGQEASEGWPTDDEARRGITPHALNERVRRLLGVERSEWPIYDDLFRLKVIGKNPFECWLLDAALTALGSSIGEFTRSRAPLPDYVEVLLHTTADLHRRRPHDRPVQELLETLAIIVRGYDEQLRTDESRALRAAAAAEKPEDWRANRVLREQLPQLAELAQRLYR